ncbi:hypothetical protein EI982_16790 [Haloplanus rallus]|uniref:Transmembrane protein n=1 Tax=Haloplanus rallus TaxID=1816183 RepID=A0A6B9F6Z5_9EURY|nr:hypothetical protein [Haloplanus rallus]QGX96315.1 hypothetical protein EI982_16790 [Haloplanus rallus]
MRGIATESIGSFLNQVLSFAVALPDIVAYGGIAVIGLYIVKLLWPSSTSTRAPQPVATASTSTDSFPSPNNDRSPDNDDTDGPSDEQEQPSELSAVDKDDSVPEDAKEEVQPSPPQQPSTIATQSATELENKTIDSPYTQQTDYSTAKRDVTKGRQGTKSSSARTGYRRSLHSSCNNRSSALSRLGRQLVDPVEVKTGVDPAGFDYSWNVAEFGLDATGASVDAGGELFYFELLRSPISHEAVGSSVEVTGSSLLRHLLREALTSGSKTTSSEQAKENNRQREPNRESPQRRQQSAQQPPADGRSQRRRRQDALPRDRVTTVDEQLPISPKREPSVYRDQIDNRVTGSSVPNNEETIRNKSRTPPTTYEPLHDFPTLDDLVDGTVYDASSGVNAAGMEVAADTSNRRDDKQLGPRMEELSQWVELPRTEPSRHSRDQAPGRRTIEEATPDEEPVTPFTEMGRGLDSIGVDMNQLDSSTQGLGGWPETDDTPMEGDNDFFGIGETASRVEDGACAVEFQVEDEVNPVLADIEAMEEELSSQQFPF